MAPPEETLPEIPGFQVLRQVGEGYSGRVFEAREDAADRVVALKVLDPARLEEPEARGRITREARLLRAHPHPHLVPLLAHDLESSRAWMSFAWMAGGDLARHTRRSRLLPEAEVRTAVARIARALDHLHARGVVHRDLKPANLLRDAGGNAYLGDLGLGKDLAIPGVTASGQVLGTWLYMSPEVKAGERALPASDRYALGVVLVHLLTAELPRRTGAGVELPDHPSLTGLSPDARAPLLECLRTEPEDRPASLEELAMALKGSP